MERKAEKKERVLTFFFDGSTFYDTLFLREPRKETAWVTNKKLRFSWKTLTRLDTTETKLYKIFLPKTYTLKL